MNMSRVFWGYVLILGWCIGALMGWYARMFTDKLDEGSEEDDGQEDTDE